MTEKDLLELFRNQPYISPCALIAAQGDRGVAYQIGENWSRAWLSGDIAVIWSNGNLTILPEDFEILVENLWDIGVKTNE